MDTLTLASIVTARSSKNQTTHCMVWKGSKTITGYGYLRWNGKNLLAHRASFMAFVSPIPKGLCVLHHCDNPPCVNPAHLFLGTQRDNVDDRDRKNRVRHGNEHPYALLTERDVVKIRQRNKSGESCYSIAKSYRDAGIGYSAIKCAAIGKTWRRVSEPAAPLQSACGRMNRHSQHKGVCWDGARSKWAARLLVDGVYRYFGRYDKESDAVAAVRTATNKYRK